MLPGTHDLIGRHRILHDVGLGRKLFKPAMGAPLIGLAGMGFCWKGAWEVAIYALRDAPLLCLGGMGLCRMWGSEGRYLSQQGVAPDLIGRYGNLQEGS